ncbi:hypothetical protein DA69_00010 [Brevundimonas naejangsanensis]|uniref:glucose-1-phosphate thymidylyltransferase n=1 Tax=Brevundimonas naejangsanensis TaxID=588932 RepID=A0A172Y967_9CAUL|nr:hypothetical protein DA69_00010 [Brevundimonas naejangsanensis]
MADAYRIGADFVDGGPSALILGDNLFYGHEAGRVFARAADTLDARRGAVVFAYRVSDPRRYGVVELDGQGRPLSIEEKPDDPRSPWAVTGLYIYDGQAPELAARLQPSARGELEITDLNRAYLEQGRLGSSVWAAASPGWTPAPPTACWTPPPSCAPWSSARASRSPAPKRSPGAWVGSTPPSWPAWPKASAARLRGLSAGGRER